MVEPLEKRLQSYSVAELRKFVSERNIKKYWKGDMSTKESIILEMMARKEIYDDIPMKGKGKSSIAPKRFKIKVKKPKEEPKQEKPKKKERSAKQKANDKRLGEMAKKRAKERKN